PEALADLAHDHVAYLRRLARTRTLLERRFYLVVPAEAELAPMRRGWPFGRKTAASVDHAVQKQLTFRCEEIERQLGGCGLSVRRLRSVELAQLFYACWCPELARVQRVQRELVDYSAMVVRASREGRP
ncbi:MAG: hypothetical protein NTZ05_10990, partial [Chloroflexi bacterium]|nr:hypothetical protein [Chloroflexota bacterium]